MNILSGMSMTISLESVYLFSIYAQTVDKRNGIARAVAGNHLICICVWTNLPETWLHWLDISAIWTGGTHTGCSMQYLSFCFTSSTVQQKIPHCFSTTIQIDDRWRTTEHHEDISLGSSGETFLFSLHLFCASVPLSVLVCWWNSQENLFSFQQMIAVVVAVVARSVEDDPTIHRIIAEEAQKLNTSIGNLTENQKEAIAVVITNKLHLLNPEPNQGGKDRRKRGWWSSRSCWPQSTKCSVIARSGVRTRGLVCSSALSQLDLNPSKNVWATLK